MKITLPRGAPNELGLSGNIDSSNASRLQAALRVKLQEEYEVLVVDCEQLDFIDSCGMAALLEYARDAKDFGGSLRLINLKPNLEYVFRMMRLTEMIELASAAK